LPNPCTDTSKARLNRNLRCPAKQPGLPLARKIAKGQYCLAVSHTHETRSDGFLDTLGPR
jgi:hypothetical protein